MSEFSIQPVTGGKGLPHTTFSSGKILSTKNHPEQAQPSGLPLESHPSVTGGSLESKLHLNILPFLPFGLKKLPRRKPKQPGKDILRKDLQGFIVTHH